MFQFTSLAKNFKTQEATGGAMKNRCAVLRSTRYISTHDSWSTI